MSLIHKYNLVCGVTLCVAASLLCASCGSGSEPVATGSDEMVFAIGDVSRAALTTQSTITEWPFTVFGDITLKKNNLDFSPTVILNGTVVTYKDGKWTYPSTQYWMPQHEHSFVAVHPGSSSALSNFQYTNSQLKFTYTQPADYQQAPDLLTATHRRYYDEGKTDDVRFRFSHALTRFGINITYNDPTLGKDAQFILKGITFNDIPVEATYTIEPAVLLNSSLPTHDYADSWETTKNGDLDIVFAEENIRVVPNDNKEHALFSDDDTLILLPNAREGSEAQMVLSFQRSEDDELETAPFDLPKWEPGKSYTLAVKMIKGSIKINISVAEWETGGNNDATVPRK